jgi:TctA family transporter
MIMICFIRPTVLAPIILAFMVVGAALATTDVGDVVMFAVFGLLGYICRRADWPRVPFIIGVVLGHLAEIYLFISVERYGISFTYNRPIVILIEVLIFAALAMPLYRRFLRAPGDYVRGMS